ncbi:MAG: hypothetical protein WCA78_08940 [Rhizomicrobium sp.]
MRARVVSSLFLLFVLAAPAFAAGRRDEGRPSLDRVLPEIRRHTPGTFYDAEGPFIGQDGQARYRIKWMTPDGRIVWFDADARTGRVLGSAPYGGYRYDNNPNRFGNWPGYDRGQDNRGGRAGREGNGGNWQRGGSGHGNSGRGRGNRN